MLQTCLRLSFRFVQAVVLWPIINNSLIFNSKAPMHHTTRLRYCVSLAFSVNNFDRSRNMVIHHGLMGSSRNFKNLSKAPAFASHVNSYLVDCRNHGDSPHTPTHSIEDLADDLCQFIK